MFSLNRHFKRIDTGTMTRQVHVLLRTECVVYSTLFRTDDGRLAPGACKQK